MEAQGMNGKLILGKGYVEIVRKGIGSFLTQGLKGNKKIAIKQISSVQFKPANLWSNRYIQISFIGGNESKGGIMAAAGDENSIMFNRGQQKDFEKVKEAIENQVYK